MTRAATNLPRSMRVALPFASMRQPFPGKVEPMGISTYYQGHSNRTALRADKLVDLTLAGGAHEIFSTRTRNQNC
jgi:hypothetical protein